MAKKKAAVQESAPKASSKKSEKKTSKLSDHVEKAVQKTVENRIKELGMNPKIEDPIVYDTISVSLNSGEDALTMEGAMDLIGWTITEDPADFHLKDLKGHKIKLVNNSTNRPLRLGLAKRYMNDMLRSKWRLNGESLIFDCRGKCQSGQHRLVAFILACQQREKDAQGSYDPWTAYGTPVQMTFECLCVFGISDKADVVDTLDIGQKRSLGDVVYRDETFIDVKDKKERKFLSNIYSHAVRLVWLRAGGRTVSDAPQFPHSEALDFAMQHPKIKEATQHVVDEDGGGGEEGRRISRYLSLGYAAGLMYLMGTSATDIDQYKTDPNPEAISYDNWDKAEEFWVMFASGELPEEDPIGALQKKLKEIVASTGFARDLIVVTVIKAFNAWMDGIEFENGADGLVVEMSTNDRGKISITEDPRIGGFDTGDVKKEKKAKDEVDETGDVKRKGIKAGDDWAVGDKAWVYSDDGHWFGTIEEIHKTEIEGEADVVMLKDDAGKVWREDIRNLMLMYPGQKKGKKKE